MIRSTFLLTLALALGLSHSAPLFCQAWCDRAPGAERADTCTHNESTTQIVLTGGIDCANVDLPATAVIRNDSTRFAATPSQHHDVDIAASQSAVALTSRFVAAVAAARPTAGIAPRAIALRI